MAQPTTIALAERVFWNPADGKKAANFNCIGKDLNGVEVSEICDPEAIKSIWHLLIEKKSRKGNYTYYVFNTAVGLIVEWNSVTAVAPNQIQAPPAQGPPPPAQPAVGGQAGPGWPGQTAPPPAGPPTQDGRLPPSRRSPYTLNSLAALQAWSLKLAAKQWSALFGRDGEDPSDILIQCIQKTQTTMFIETVKQKLLPPRREQPQEPPQQQGPPPDAYDDYPDALNEEDDDLPF
jgi:hypothetical protein